MRTSAQPDIALPSLQNCRAEYLPIDSAPWSSCELYELADMTNLLQETFTFLAKMAKSHMLRNKTPFVSWGT